MTIHAMEKLVIRALALLEQFGSLSEPFLQRRLKVTAKEAQKIMEYIGSDHG